MILLRALFATEKSLAAFAPVAAPLAPDALLLAAGRSLCQPCSLEQSYLAFWPELRNECQYVRVPKIK